MSRTAEIGLLSSQIEFVNSKAMHTGFVAGFGSGKSMVGTFKTILKKIQFRNYSVAYYLPTYGLIRDIAFPKFTELLNKLELTYTINKTDKEIIIKDYGSIILRSMDNPETIVGYEVAYSCIDEADIIPQLKMSEIFINVIARNRSLLPNNELNCTDIVSSPNGFGWLYHFFVKNASDNKFLIKAKTTDNPYLPDGYIKTLMETYDAQQLEAYINGEFVNLTAGSVYKDYDRKRCHTNREVQKHDKLSIGLDFNITKMAAVVHVIEGGKYYAVDELVNVYDTETMIRLLKDKYEGHHITIYPDASGKSRNSSGKSDVQLLIEAGFAIRAPGKNPFVRDRVNAMNAAFRNGQYFVNSFHCPEYTAALEQISYRNGEPDKTSGLDHICDSGGYFLYMVSRISFTI